MKLFLYSVEVLTLFKAYKYSYFLVMFAYQHVLLTFVMILNPLLGHRHIDLHKLPFEIVVFRNMILEPTFTLNCKKR